MTKMLCRYVVEATVRVTGVPLEALKSTSRLAYIVSARKALYRATPELGLSLSEMGRYIGRDHSTLSHVILQNRESYDERQLVEEVKAKALEIAQEKHLNLVQAARAGVLL